MLNVSDPLFGNVPVGDAARHAARQAAAHDARRAPASPAPRDDFDGARTSTCAKRAFRLLRLPTVADKTFLVTIGDRSVGGMISRDPLVGPWQVPVSDVAVTVSDYFSTRGEAMAMGERTPLALLDAAASARMAVAEAVTNIAAADIARLEDVRLSANWMAACGEPGEDADLYDAVRAVGEEFCPALGIAIPVGKDSLSMKTAWQDGDGARKVVAPVSLIVSAFAPVAGRAAHAHAAAAHGSRRHATAAGRSRRRTRPARRLLPRAGVRAQSAARRPTATTRGACGLSSRRSRGCDAPASCSRTTIDPTAGCSSRSCEMAFAGHCGIEVDLVAVGGDSRVVAALFSEELGAVLQVGRVERAEVLAVLRESGLEDCVRTIGRVTGRTA